MNMTRGFKVKRMRELMGKKQDEVAYALGLKQNSYSALEAGRVKISDERLEKIAEIIGTTPETIDAYTEGYVTNIVNNHTGSINAAGAGVSNSNIYSCEDLQKIVEIAVTPWKEMVASLKEQAAMQHEQIMLLLGQRKKEG
jgi:transcriptional regulator with XRE-family HTH domain